MHCKVEKTGVDSMNIVWIARSSDELCSVDIASAQYTINQSIKYTFRCHLLGSQHQPQQQQRHRVDRTHSLTRPACRSFRSTRYLHVHWLRLVDFQTQPLIGWLSKSASHWFNSYSAGATIGWFTSEPLIGNFLLSFSLVKFLLCWGYDWLIYFSAFHWFISFSASYWLNSYSAGATIGRFISQPFIGLYPTQLLIG